MAPAMITVLRPKASESGPVTKVPSPMPKTKLVMMNWARFGAPGLSSSAISGMAGSIESIEKAVIAKSMARRATNSGIGRRRMATPGAPIGGVIARAPRRRSGR